MALLEVIKDDLVDVIKLTPSHLSLLDERQLKSSRVRQLILGGENLTLELATRVLSNFPDGVIIHNEYGPTEATVGCIVYSFDEKASEGSVRSDRASHLRHASLCSESQSAAPADGSCR